jgi:hypothetical protein
MNPSERLDLQKMIRVNDAQDYTEDIRAKAHSKPLHEDVQKLLSLKHNYKRLAKTNPGQFDSMCVSQCSFLFNNYTDIFNKVKKDELNLDILISFINTLKSIEDGQLDQHEASVKVGKLLKELYIDSALRKADKLDNNIKNKEKTHPEKKITWKQYKNLNIN